MLQSIRPYHGRGALTAAVAVVLALPPAARADDCAPVMAAMMASAKAPNTMTLTRTKNGQPQVDHMVQTPTTSYMQLNGKWMSMQVTTQERIDTINEMMKTAKMTCQKTGTESVGGQTAVVYTSHVENEDNVSDNKLWVSPDNLVLKAEIHIAGEKDAMVSAYDYSHVEVPANATPMGSK